MIAAPVMAAVKYRYRRNPGVNASATSGPFVFFTGTFYPGFPARETNI
jgi:hypothetical protein